MQLRAEHDRIVDLARKFVREHPTQGHMRDQMPTSVLAFATASQISLRWSPRLRALKRISEKEPILGLACVVKQLLRLVRCRMAGFVRSEVGLRLRQPACSAKSRAASIDAIAVNRQCVSDRHWVARRETQENTSAGMALDRPRHCSIGLRARPASCPWRPHGPKADRYA